MAHHELQTRECLEREIRLLFDEGAVRGAMIVGMNMAWRVMLETEQLRLVLIAEKSKKPREFAKLDTAMSWLYDLGIRRFVVDASFYETFAGGA